MSHNLRKSKADVQSYVHPSNYDENSVKINILRHRIHPEAEHRSINRSCGNSKIEETAGYLCVEKRKQKLVT